eukprot:3016915-Ditylum_brightwellii.AAC.1
MAISHRNVYDKFKQCYDGHFNYTTSEGNLIQYLNTRIIVSSYGISLNITDYIIQKMCKTTGIN